MTEGEQQRLVKHRLAVLQHAEEAIGLGAVAWDRRLTSPPVAA